MDRNTATAVRLQALASEVRDSASVRKFVEERRKVQPDYAPSLDAAHFDKLDQQAEDLEHAARVLRNPPRVVISDAYKAVQAREEQLLRGGRAIGHFMRFVSKVRPLIDEAPHRLGAPAISAIDETLHDIAVALGIEKILFGEDA